MTVGLILELQLVLRNFAKSSWRKKVKVWSAEGLILAKIAESQPYVAFSAFTHGLSSWWRFVFRTVPDIAEFL